MTTIKKKTGPTKKTPVEWKSTGINLCEKMNTKCKRLVMKDKSLNRDLIIHKALEMYFTSLRTSITQKVEV